MSEAAQLSRDQVKDFLKNLSLLDAAALVKELEAGAGRLGGGADGGGGGARRRAQRQPRCEKDEFT